MNRRAVAGMRRLLLDIYTYDATARECARDLRRQIVRGVVAGRFVPPQDMTDSKLRDLLATGPLAGAPISTVN